MTPAEVTVTEQTEEKSLSHIYKEIEEGVELPKDGVVERQLYSKLFLALIWQGWKNMCLPMRRRLSMLTP